MGGTDFLQDTDCSNNPLDGVVGGKIFDQLYVNSLLFAFHHLTFDRNLIRRIFWQTQ